MVRVYDQGTDGDLNYLTMEFIEGPNLRQRLATTGTIPLGEAMRIAEKLLETIGAAHRLGLVHRDVKPENVLMDSDGEPKLADFGLARAVTEVTSTTTGTILGHRRLPRPRARLEGPERRPHGRVRDGHPSVRDGDGTPALHGPVGDRGRLEARPRGRAPPVDLRLVAPPRVRRAHRTHVRPRSAQAPVRRQRGTRPRAPDAAA